LLARAGSAAAVVVLAGGGVMATSAAADAASHGKAPQPTTLSIKNKAIAHNHHHADAITGVLRSHRKGVNGETVTLESRTGKKPRWVSAGSGTTATGTDGVAGEVTITVTAPTVKTQYKLVFGGDTANHLRKSHSNTITIKKA
jgi:hypothetical protein